jgi:hypothetical protein
MKMNSKQFLGFIAAALFSISIFAKIPPPPPAPPADPAAVAAKAEKDKAAAEKAKALQAAAEDNAVKNFQANMKKAGKPIPKPTPIVVATAPTAPAATPAKGTVPAKDAKSVAK